VCVCARARVCYKPRIYIHTHLLYACARHGRFYRHAYNLASIHTYIHTYKHTQIHTENEPDDTHEIRPESCNLCVFLCLCVVLRGVSTDFENINEDCSRIMISSILRMKLILRIEMITVLGS